MGSKEQGFVLLAVEGICELDSLGNGFYEGTLNGAYPLGKCGI